MLTLNEVFVSIQGESTRAGVPCVFVRLAGCDLRCRWCDTPYAFTEGVKKTVEDAVSEVLGSGCPMVEITGGEPLLQADVYPLMERLLAAGRTVLLETGGHRSLVGVPAGVVRIVDIKCPASGEAGTTDWSNLALLRPGDELKFVLQDRGDYEFAARVIAERHLPSLGCALLVSPVHGVLDPKDLARWILDDRLPVRLQLQVHKYIWGADARGV